MEQGKFEGQSPQEQRPPIKIAGSIGLAEQLLREKGNLKSQNAWFGITIREKVYPDSKVIDLARWGNKNCKNFLIVIADGAIVPHNIIAMGNKKVNYDNMPELINEVGELSEKRKEKLTKFIHAEGLKNVKVKLWSEILTELSDESESNNIAMHYADQLLDRERYLNNEFEEKLRAITKDKIGDVLKRAIKNKKNFLKTVPIMGYVYEYSSDFESQSIDAMINSDDSGQRAWGEKIKRAKENLQGNPVAYAAATYAKEEISMTWILAIIGNRPIKVGSPWERAYDELTLDLIKKDKPIKMENAKFGAVYLK